MGDDAYDEGRAVPYPWEDLEKHFQAFLLKINMIEAYQKPIPQGKQKKTHLHCAIIKSSLLLLLLVNNKRVLFQEKQRNKQKKVQQHQNGSWRSWPKNLEFANFPQSSGIIPGLLSLISTCWSKLCCCKQTNYRKGEAFVVKYLKRFFFFFATYFTL